MRGCASRTDGWLFCSLQKDYLEMVKNVVRGWQARKIMVHYCVIFFPLAVERGDEVRGLQEFHFVANTQEGERHVNIAFAVSAIVSMIVCWIVFDGLLGVPSPWLWLLIVVPAVVVTSFAVRYVEKQTMGMYALRLNRRHLTIVCPDQTVIDLGEVLRFGFDRFADDDKRARLSIDGSKDSICLSMRSGAAWNGRSTKKDFIEIGKAAMAIEEALAQAR